MFSDFELEQKKNAFNYSKLRFEKMNEFLNNDQGKFRDEYTNYSLIFITIARFISFKEDIWVKNKKTKDIFTNFSKEILDDYLFNGKLKSAKIDFLSERKRNLYNLTPIQISTILKGKERDSVWIIDNIRDSIAHGHYYIDFTTNDIIIKNDHPDRLLECSLKFDLFFGLNELITEERIGGYTDKKLTTVPILHFIWKKDKPKLQSIKSEFELKKLLKNNFIVNYSKVIDCFEEDENKKYNDLLKFFNFNARLTEELYRKIRGNNSKSGFYYNYIDGYYDKKVASYVDNNMSKYNITIFSDFLDDKTIDILLSYIREQPRFYKRPIDEQGLILQGMLKSILSNEEITIERGITDFVESYTSSALKKWTTDNTNKNHLTDLVFGNVNSFRENKKLANLHILALNNFVSNKESIYDKYFEDYNEFDISNFDYQDYSGYDRLVSKLKTLNNDLAISNNELQKALASKNKLNDNLSKAPEDKKEIISNNLKKTNILINNINNTINNLILEINSIENEIDNAKKDSNGHYINSNNKSFFNHLRNAFAHNHIKYIDNRLVYNRKVLLEDFDDDRNLTFKCICRYYDLVKLFNNELFLESLSKEKTLKR